MTDLPILSLTIFLPIFTIIILAFGNFLVGRTKQIYAAYTAALGSLMTLIASLYLLFSFDVSLNNYQFVEHFKWLPNLGLEYHLAADNLSLFFILLTSIISFLCIIFSIFSVKEQLRTFLISILLVESCAIGAFSAVNLLLFYLFFEFSLIPIYFLIGIFGGDNKLYAAVKFFLYTFFGSILFLAALIYLYSLTSTFNLSALPDHTQNLTASMQHIIFFLIFIALAIKIPMLPFHTWLPDAHVQAPTAGSVLLAGVLLKFGGYGLLRILLPLFPELCKTYASHIVILSIAAIIYASLVASCQKNMKKMIAYSSVAHMGYVTGGIFSLNEFGIKGAIYQMLSHGFISSALFLIIGCLYQRLHQKDIASYQGVADRMPKLAFLFMITSLGAIGLPATSGFIAEFLSLSGVYNRFGIVEAIFMVSGIVFSAFYMLNLYKNTMFGEITNFRIKMIRDLHSYELFTIVVCCFFIIYLGIAPKYLLNALDMPRLINQFK